MKEVTVQRPQEYVGPQLNVGQLVSEQANRERALFQNPSAIRPAFENIYLERYSQDPGNGDLYRYLTQIDNHGNATVLSQRMDASNGLWMEIIQGSYDKKVSDDLEQKRIDLTPHQIYDHITGKVWTTQVTNWGVTGVAPSPDNSFDPRSAAALAFEFQEKQQMAYVFDRNGNIIDGPGIGRPLPGQPAMPFWQMPPVQAPDIQVQQPAQVPDTQGAQPPTNDLQQQLADMQSNIEGIIDVVTAPSKPDQTQEKILATLEQNRQMMEALSEAYRDMPAVMAGIFVRAMEQYDEAAREGRKQDQETFKVALTAIVDAAKESLRPIQADPVAAPTTAPSVSASPDSNAQVMGELTAIRQQLEEEKNERPQEIEQIVRQILEAQTRTRNLEVAALISQVDLDRRDATTGEIKQFDAARGQQIREMQENIAYLEGGIANLEGLLNQILANQEAQAVASAASVGVSQDLTQPSDDELAEAPASMDPEDNDLLTDDEDVSAAGGSDESESGDGNASAKPWPESEDLPGPEAAATEAGSGEADDAAAEEHRDIPLGTVLLGSMLSHGGEIVPDEEERQLTRTGTLQTDDASREVAGQARDVTPQGEPPHVTTDLRDATRVETSPGARAAQAYSRGGAGIPDVESLPDFDPAATAEERELVAVATAVAVLERTSNGNGSRAQAITIPDDQDAPWSPIWMDGAPIVESVESELPDWATQDGATVEGKSLGATSGISPASTNGYLSSHQVFNGSGVFNEHVEVGEAQPASEVEDALIPTEDISLEKAIEGVLFPEAVLLDNTDQVFGTDVETSVEVASEVPVPDVEAFQPEAQPVEASNHDDMLDAIRRHGGVAAGRRAHAHFEEVISGTRESDFDLLGAFGIEGSNRPTPESIIDSFPMEIRGLITPQKITGFKKVYAKDPLRAKNMMIEYLLSHALIVGVEFSEEELEKYFK